MKKLFISFIACFSLMACNRNSITGRNQLSLIPESELMQMSISQYRQFLNTNQVVSPSNNKDAEMVRRIGGRIAKAVTNYYSSKGLVNELSNYQWEYNLVNSNQVNAWCMPGGKIVVYTGLLSITQNEAALAVVMGHEIAHALAQHGNERMSQGMLQQLGGLALSAAIANKPAETQNLFNTAFGIGTSVGIMLPHSRKQELEADKLGLMFSALAGYNPQEAIPLWKRMAQTGGGQRPLEFLSTHPAENRRIQELHKIMDDVIKNYYRPMNSEK